VMLHRACHAVIILKGTSSIPAESDLLTLSGFKRLVTIQLPRVLVTPCGRCQVPCTGECVCGASYCSAACLDAGECSGCGCGESSNDKKCAEELMYLTPVAWGAAPLALHSRS
jgi:hypothetical protein